MKVWIILWYATLVLPFCYIANALVLLVTVADPVYFHPFSRTLKQWDQLPSLSGLEEDPPFQVPCSSSGFALGGCRLFFLGFALGCGWFNGAVNAHAILHSHCAGFI